MHLQVTVCSRVRLLAADRVSFGVLLATRGGAFAWLQPLTSQHHATLAALQAALHNGVAHAAGLNPKRYRLPSADAGLGPGEKGYGVPPASDGVLDGGLLWQYAQLARATQERVAHAAGVETKDALAALQEAAVAAAFF